MDLQIVSQSKERRRNAAEKHSGRQEISNIRPFGNVATLIGKDSQIKTIKYRYVMYFGA